MKTIKFNVDAVLPALVQASKVVGNKNSIAILDNLLLQVINGKLSATASDTETWIDVDAQIAEGEDGTSICVSAKDFVSALGNLKGCFVTLEVNEDTHTVKCDYGKGRFSMPFENTDEFPQPAIINTDTAINISLSASRLYRAIEKASFATAQDELRPQMNGIHFDFFADGMVTVASDGHKLAKHKDLDVKHDGDVVGFTLPKKPSFVVMNIINGLGDANVNISFNANTVVFSSDGFKLSTRLVESRYPNYDSVIPTAATIETNINRKDFIAALKRVLPMGNASSQLTKLNFRMGEVEISAEDYDFSKSATERVDCDFASQEFTIGFKGSTLLEIVSNVDGEFVKIGLTDPSRAGVFKPAQDLETTEYTSICMPMLIQ